MMLAVAVVLLACAAIVTLVAVMNAIVWQRVRPFPAASGDAGGPSISILIPARNEAENLPDCLNSASSQGASVGEILVYDDHSTDSTPTIVQAAAERDPRVRLLPGQPLEDGWLGKPLACWRLAAAAQGDWLLFIDADARLRPGSAAGLLAAAQRDRLTFLSAWPGLELRGLAERALMPMLNFVVYTLFPTPIARRKMRDPSLGLAHGACLLIERATYARLGGHRLVRDQLFEDTTLARAWRAGGERGLCLDGQDVVRVRMYADLAGIWHGFQKNFFPAFRSPRSFWLFWLFHLALLLPFVLLPFVRGRAGALIGAAAGLVLLARLALALRFRHPAWSVLLHPLAQIVLLALGIVSWWKCRTGRGVTWKGRVYQSRSGRSTLAASEPVAPPNLSKL